MDNAIGRVRLHQHFAGPKGCRMRPAVVNVVRRVASACCVVF
jgi:hypothetical protein